MNETGILPIKQEICNHQGKWKVVGISARNSETAKKNLSFVISIFCKECGEIKIKTL